MPYARTTSFAFSCVREKTPKKRKRGQLAGNFIGLIKAFKGSPETIRRITFYFINTVKKLKN